MAIIISDTEPRVQYTATAGQTSFTVPFEFFANADLKVFNGTTQLTFAASPSTASEYSVSGAGQTGGGSITLGGSGATLNDIITIYRDLAIERTTDFPTSGAFQINSLNTELDKIIAMAQQLERDLKFSPRAAATTSNTFNITFPNLVANKVLSVNSAGNGLEFTQNVTDIITIAGIASDVTTVSNIAADVTTVANDATDIGIVSTNIASVNTVATNIADVITVANDLNEAISEVETVADDLNEAVSEIDTVSNNITDVQTVGNATNINNISLVAGQISPTNNIATIAGLTVEIGEVAAIDNDVTAVAAIDSNVTVVAANNANITTVGNNLSGANTIGTVATNIANVNIVGGINSQVSTVAGIDTEVVAVAADATDIGTVASNIGNVTAVGNDLSNNFSYIEDNGSIADAVTSTAGTSLIETVADDIANVNAVASNLNGANTIGTVATNLTGTNTIGTVATNINNVNLVGGSIGNVNTVGSNIGTVNDFAQKYRVVASDPTTSLDAGDLAYNTTANVLKYYNGSTWNPVVAGALTDIVQDGTPQLGGDLDGQNYNLNNIGTIDGTNLQIDFGGL